MQKKRLLIIGAGVGGLAAGVRARGMGHEVLVLEKNPLVGGKLNIRSIRHPRRPDERPFRFDTGPSLLTLPLVFADLFAFVGKDVRDYLSISRLDPVSRFVWADGQSLELNTDREKLLNSVKQFAPQDVNGMKRFLDYGKHVWELSGEFFLTRAPEQAFRGEGAFSLFNAFRTLSIPFRIGMFKKYAALVDQHIRSPRLREVLYQYATYSGSSPFLAPATLAVIAHVELELGGWYVKGGMYRLAEALEQLATEIGVQIQTNTTVTTILVEECSGKTRVKGVALSDGSILQADAVIVNADVIYAYQNLIDPKFRQRFSNPRLNRIEPGGSGMVLCLGVEGTYPQLAHHTKFMPDDYTSDLRAMFETRTVPEDPCIYVCASTRTDPSQAPADCENLFILCSAPALDGRIDWTTEGPKYRDRIIHQLEHRFGMTNLSQRIVAETHFTPADLKQLYNAHAGSIYGISGNGIRQAFLRPPNRDRQIGGLFFAGGATHPGGGLPLVALSGKIASELADEYLKREVLS